LLCKQETDSLGKRILRVLATSDTDLDAQNFF